MEIGAQNWISTENYYLVRNFYLIPLIVWSKAWVCGRSLAGTAASNSAWAWMSVCCQVEVSATGLSLVRRSPTEYGVCLSMISKPEQHAGPSPLGTVEPWKKRVYTLC